MSRPLRIEFPGAFYHVYARGLERRKIFRDTQDYRKFLKVVLEVWRATSFVCHSYCVMPNHSHFYLETPLGNLSKIMHDINGRYSQYYNLRYGRVGPLFQGRYQAKVVEHDQYSLQLSRYIHLNPVRANLVTNPARWRWSSYGAFMGIEKCPEFLDMKWLMSEIGGQKSLERFTLDGLKGDWDPAHAAGKGPVMGGQDFVEKIKDKIRGRQKDSSLTGLRQLREGQRVDEVQRAVTKLKCDDRLKRKLLIYGWRRYTELSLATVAQKVQASSALAICQTVRRFAKKAKTDKRIAELLRTLESKMGSGV